MQIYNWMALRYLQEKTVVGKVHYRGGYII